MTHCDDCSAKSLFCSAHPCPAVLLRWPDRTGDGSMFAPTLFLHRRSAPWPNFARSRRASSTGGTSRRGYRPSVVAPLRRGPHGADCPPWGGSSGRLAVLGATLDFHHRLLRAGEPTPGPRRHAHWSTPTRTTPIARRGTLANTTGAFTTTR